MTPYRLMRPRVGLMPTRDAVVDGHTIEPSVSVPSAAAARLAEIDVPEPELESILIDIYRKDALVASLCERLVDLDEGIQEWRYRHVKMVQRTIGTKRGTGGSEGAEYLMKTLNHPMFPDLWAIRADL